MDFVKLYLKLPRWFTVPTPVGDYSPDWALVVEERDEFGGAAGENMIYMVSETKGTKVLDELRTKERRKNSSAVSGISRELSSGWSTSLQ